MKLFLIIKKSYSLHLKLLRLVMRERKKERERERGGRERRKERGRKGSSNFNIQNKYSMNYFPFTKFL